MSNGLDREKTLSQSLEQEIHKALQLYEQGSKLTLKAPLDRFHEKYLEKIGLKVNVKLQEWHMCKETKEIPDVDLDRLWSVLKLFERAPIHLKKTPLKNKGAKENEGKQTPSKTSFQVTSKQLVLDFEDEPKSLKEKQKDLFSSYINDSVSKSS